MSQTQFKIKTTRNGGLGLAMAGRGPAKPLRQRGRRADSNKWQTQSGTRLWSGRHSVLDSVRQKTSALHQQAPAKKLQQSKLKTQNNI